MGRVNQMNKLLYEKKEHVVKYDLKWYVKVENCELIELLNYVNMKCPFGSNRN